VPQLHDAQPAQNQSLQAEPGANPLRVEEVFRAPDRWDLDRPRHRPKTGAAGSVIRRNLQSLSTFGRLTSMVLGSHSSNYGDMFSYLMVRGGGSVPADARALARLHLGEIGEKIDKVLAAKDVKIDDTTRAHLKECRQRITKTLEANFEGQQP